MDIIILKNNNKLIFLISCKALFTVNIGPKIHDLLPIDFMVICMMTQLQARFT